ncbi:hypothetical protein AKO1_006492, partial [Acrasis kona]
MYQYVGKTADAPITNGSLFPPEILEHIVPFMGGVAGICSALTVCRSWYTKLLENNFWRSVERSVFNTDSQVDHHRWRYMERLILHTKQQEQIQIVDGLVKFTFISTKENLFKMKHDEQIRAHACTIRIFSRAEELAVQFPLFSLARFKNTLFTTKQPCYVTEWAYNQGTTESTHDLTLVYYKLTGTKITLCLNYTYILDKDQRTLLLSTGNDGLLRDILNNTVNFSDEQDKKSMSKVCESLLNISKILGIKDDSINTCQVLMHTLLFILEGCDLRLDIDTLLCVKNVFE